MRTFIMIVLICFSSSAHAWDGPTMWYEPADAASPGGGGIFGTGGARDYNITCEHCHVERPMGAIDATVTFTPPLGAGYVADQQYQVRVDLIGEIVGTSGCGQYMRNVNNFAAVFENASGAVVGTLTSDSGQTATSCPADYPMPGGGTTALYRDCEVIFSRDLENRTSWSFSWRAPASGTGTVTMSYGVVDGDCTMMSMGDAVKMGKLELDEASAAVPSRRRPYAIAALLALALLAFRSRGLALLLLVASCGGDAKEDGTLGGACLPGNACSAGLICTGGVCVENGGGEPDGSAPPTGDGGAPIDAASATPDAAGQPPTAQINHPGDGEVRPAGAEVPFIGVASDPEDGALSGSSLVWSTNLDGEIGTGEMFNRVLSVGVHTITLTATDSDGNVGADSIVVTIQ